MFNFNTHQCRVIAKINCTLIPSLTDAKKPKSRIIAHIKRDCMCLMETESKQCNIVAQVNYSCVIAKNKKFLQCGKVFNTFNALNAPVHSACRYSQLSNISNIACEYRSVRFTNYSSY